MFYYTPKVLPIKSLKTCKIGEKAIGKDGSTYVVNMIKDKDKNTIKKIWLKIKIIEDSDNESEND
jgi:hypothetical protein